MNKIYDIFEMTLPTKKAKNNKMYIKKHKIRNLNSKKTKENYLYTYNELIYHLYRLKLKDSNDLETISKLEFKVSEYECEFNIKSTEKIDSILSALEKYYEEIKQEETISLIKRRGLYIYEDLSFKLHKLKNNTPLNNEKIKKLEQKLTECQNKYALSELEQIDAKIKSLEKYNELLIKQEENKTIGLNYYKNLINELNNLKKENIKNISKIIGLETKIKKCSNTYNLNNLDKITIQLNILEEQI